MSKSLSVVLDEVEQPGAQGPWTAMQVTAIMECGGAPLVALQINKELDAHKAGKAALVKALRRAVDVISKAVPEMAYQTITVENDSQRIGMLPNWLQAEADDLSQELAQLLSESPPPGKPESRKDAEETDEGSCICNAGFGMNLSCPKCSTFLRPASSEEE